MRFIAMTYLIKVCEINNFIYIEIEYDCQGIVRLFDFERMNNDFINQTLIIYKIDVFSLVYVIPILRKLSVLLLLILHFPNIAQ